MVTTQLVQIKIIKGDLEFVFNMPATSTWGTAIDATNDLLATVCDMAKQSLGAQAPAELAAPIEPEIVEGTQDGN